MGQPCLYGRNAGFDVGVGRVLGGFSADDRSGCHHVSVTMEVEAADDVTKVEEAADEEEGSKDRALGDPLINWREGGGVTREGDELLPVYESGREPVTK